MARKETAEEKLLKIIEATKKAQAAAASGGAAVSVAQKRSARLTIGVRQINIFLVVCMIASLIFLSYEIRKGLELLQQSVSISADTKVSGSAVNIFVPQVKSVSYYLDKIASRNIFKPYEKQAVETTSVTTGRALLEKKMAKYKLVGIAWLDVPESATVMMEDPSTRMTHFLKQGDKIEDVTVKTIYTDRAVFSCANEEIVIKL